MARTLNGGMKQSFRPFQECQGLMEKLIELQEGNQFKIYEKARKELPS